MSEARYEFISQYNTLVINQCRFKIIFHAKTAKLTAKDAKI